MEFEEMNQRAYRREAPPDELTPAERMIYMALCSSGHFSRDNRSRWSRSKVMDGLCMLTANNLNPVLDTG